MHTQEWRGVVVKLTISSKEMSRCPQYSVIEFRERLFSLESAWTLLMESQRRIMARTGILENLAGHKDGKSSQKRNKIS